MTNRSKVLVGALAAMLMIVAAGLMFVADTQAGTESAVTVEQGSETTKLGVVWSSGDREVALKMVFMYTHNAKKAGWFDEVQFIVWGPSEKLLAEDEELQEKVAQMMEDGIEVVACRACSDMYGVSSDLEECGVDVKYMGRPLTNLLQSDWKIITF
ncbi:DsrE family protein [Gemmatimonadota bacterium]